MKVKINRLPAVFTGGKVKGGKGKVASVSGMVELNLSRLVKNYPYMKTTLCNIVGVKPDRIDFTDEKYIVRMILHNGEIAEAEIGYPEDEWRIQKTEENDDK